MVELLAQLTLLDEIGDVFTRFPCCAGGAFWRA